MNKTEKVAVNLLRPINPSLIVIMGLYTVLWGAWIFAPWWSVFTHAPLYNAMAHLAPEYVWGATAMACGVLITRGAIKPARRNLQLGAFVGALHWFVISLFYFIGDWASTGGITSLTFAVYCGLIWVNIKVNPDHYDYKPLE